jgi:gamma-glutamylcyclotransferase (GGCT)/AIG2-like uncharacterized protein YtfP
MAVKTAMLPVFVYGLLRPGCAGFAELKLGERAIRIAPDRIAGRLYDLGDYPGVVLGGESIVVGELLLPRDSGVLADLDGYEQYDPVDPGSSEYLRTRVTTLGGREAWVYAYRQEIGDRPVIAGGDWLAVARSRQA